ncbi:7713_t:CDS:2, partial [Scutellospora calospora]
NTSDASTIKVNTKIYQLSLAKWVTPVTVTELFNGTESIFAIDGAVNEESNESLNEAMIEDYQDSDINHGPQDGISHSYQGDIIHSYQNSISYKLAFDTDSSDEESDVSLLKIAIC